MKVFFIRVTLFCLAGWHALAGAAEVVNVYSARHYDTDLALYDNFYKKTGIKVNLLEAASDTLIERIVNEGKYSPADILITVDAGRLYRAEQKGIFTEVRSPILEKRIPAQFRHPDGLWFGLSKRARLIIYSKKAGEPKNLKTYQDLVKPEFKNQVCVRSSSNIYNISLLASIISHEGESGALNWAQGIMSNLHQRPQGNDTSNIKAVALVKCRISIVNSYYLARMIADDPKILDDIGIVYPNQNTTGTHVNISGAGVTRYAPNRENAIKFIEYLTEASAQYLFVEGNHEYPIADGAKVTSAIATMGTFTEDKINASQLGVNQAKAVKIFDQAGWH